MGEVVEEGTVIEAFALAVGECAGEMKALVELLGATTALEVPAANLIKG